MQVYWAVGPTPRHELRATPHLRDWAAPPPRQPSATAWRAALRLPPCLHDPTFPCDTIRREHSPPLHPPFTLQQTGRR